MTPVSSAIRRPELLAPAGGPDAFVAAVNNGADAIYLGLSDLNARRGAANFDLESLARSCRFAHLRGVRVYLTANVLIMPEEMSWALQMVDAAWAAGVDAVIVQDLGLLRVLREVLPDVRVHASTQINAHDSATIKALADLGVSRVTLAREVALEEIQGFVADAPIEIEAFVHGAICVSYSGQCLMSSTIGGRSANRGLCAQPCRLQYSLVDEAGEPATTTGRHLLSPKDSAAVAHLGTLVRSGISALKIEGRMKAPEYVAVVVGVYRAALDRAIEDPEGFGVTPAEWSLLEEAFNRGFTDAYLLGTSGNELMSYMRPNNRGVPLGRVAATGPGWAEVTLDRALESEDVIEFWTSRGRSAQRAGEMDVGSGPLTSAPSGARVRITMESAVSEGDRVFRVVNAALLDAARRTFLGGAATDHRATPVVLSVRLRVGLPLHVEATAGGVVATAEGPIVEPARTKTVTLDEVIEHVGRVGGSGYSVERWDVDLEHGVGVSFSALHRARRDALDALDVARLAQWSRRERVDPVLPAVTRTPKRAASIDIVVSAGDREVAAACLAAGASRVLLRVTAADDVIDLPPGIEPLLPRIAHDAESERLARWLRPGSCPVVGTLGELAAATATGLKAEADWPLNVMNPWSASALARLGASFVWASPELTGSRLRSVVEGSPVPVGTLTYGRLELMVTEHCVLQAAGECSQHCVICSRRAARWTLIDQKEYGFPVVTDATGRSHVYNSVTLDLSRALDEVVATGIAAVRLEMTLESPDEASRITAGFASALASLQAGGVPPETAFVTPATSGHFFRGVR